MTTRVQKILRLALVAALLGGVAASAGPSAAATLPPFPGSLPDSTAPRDVSGRGDFSGLKIHVNQTADLTTQAVSLTWSWPGRSTKVGTDNFHQGYVTNVLRVMQCWGPEITSPGTDAATAANYVAGNEGPAREHCEYGGSLKPLPLVADGNQNRRTGTAPPARGPLTYGMETVYKPTPATLGEYAVPFVAANGTVVPSQQGLVAGGGGTLAYSNEFYDSFSTNESPANFTFGPDGRGGVQFQVQNSADARGLGCGAPSAADPTVLNKCWLAIVPQGETDLDGSSFGPSRSGYYTTSAFGSPLASTNWANRIVVPLDFLPTVSACASAGNTYSTLGSPLVASALLGWQSKLCGTTGAVFDYAQGTDQRSRDALTSGTTAMQFVSDPVPQGTGATPITYAPLTLSGLGIGFIWDKATFDNRTSVSSPGLPLTTIKLNQRLVAKLLTYSYQDGNSRRISPNSAENTPPVLATEAPFIDYQWLVKNPVWLGSDPEFLALNPDLTAGLPRGVTLFSSSPDIATIQGPLNGSDAISRLWKWIMADRDARNFMAGVPDPYGMVVDPWFSTNPDVNPSGFAFATNIDGLPYADPWTGKPGSPEPLCPEQTALSMTDYWPAARDFTAVAKDILTVNPLEKVGAGFACPNTADPNQQPGWSTARTGVPPAGFRQLMGMTDTASGAQFGVTYASLPNAAGQYVQPTPAAITAASNHLVESGVPGVQQPDLTSTDPAAYPLSLIGYAGVTTDGTPRDACAAYASLLAYAGGAGQVPGTSIGNLPPGYVPLSAPLRQRTLTAAATVAQCAQTAPPADQSVDDNSAETNPPGSTDTGSDTGTDTAVSGGGSTDPGTSANSPSSSAPNRDVSLAATSKTKPDPSVFAYVVPIALGLGVLALLGAPLAGLRRRRPGDPPGAGS